MAKGAFELEEHRADKPAVNLSRQESLTIRSSLIESVARIASLLHPGEPVLATLPVNLHKTTASDEGQRQHLIVLYQDAELDCMQYEYTDTAPSTDGITTIYVATWRKNGMLDPGNSTFDIFVDSRLPLKKDLQPAEVAPRGIPDPTVWYESADAFHDFTLGRAQEMHRALSQFENEIRAGN